MCWLWMKTVDGMKKKIYKGECMLVEWRGPGRGKDLAIYWFISYSFALQFYITFFVYFIHPYLHFSYPCHPITSPALHILPVPYVTPLTCLCHCVILLTWSSCHTTCHPPHKTRLPSTSHHSRLPASRHPSVPRATPHLFHTSPSAPSHHSHLYSER